MCIGVLPYMYKFSRYVCKFCGYQQAGHFIFEDHQPIKIFVECVLYCVWLQADILSITSQLTSKLFIDASQSILATVAIENEMKNVVSSLVSPNKVVTTS